MNILVSNDDGINSKSLHALVKRLSEIGDVYVVAPDCERSANSHHFTFKGRMRIEEKSVEGAKKAYALWGTPCDCIHAGLQFIVKEKIDLIVSGINKGWNVSSDIIYSGTIAAAREGFMDGVRSIAFSLDNYEDCEYEVAADIAKEITEKYISEPYTGNYFLNVNIPDCPKEEIKGIKVCGTSGKIHYDENYSLEEEFGVYYVKLGATTETYLFDEDNLDIDCNCVNQKYIAISPLYNNHINSQYLNELKEKWER